VDLVREKASLLGFKDHPLDALLDEYDPGLTTKEVSTLFSALKPKLKNLLEKIKKTPFYEAAKRPCSASLEEQLRLSREILTSIGYDWDRSRLDTAAHPFSSAGHPTDSRITIRHNHEDTLDQIRSAMHEAGHSLYEMGLSRQYYGTPLGEAASLSIHEGQSRFWETIIGSSKMFCTRLFTLLNKHLKSHPLPDAETLYRQLNSVQCSPIRTQADEVTYPFHVFLRFEIEKGLLEGSLNVRDIPERWNQGMQEMLGITPSCEREGCLQDIHWSSGYFGYFPTYVLGSMYAASLWEALQKDLPDVKELIQAGVFAPIHTWLHDRVWSHGRRFRSKHLIERALGKPPSEKEYLSYLDEKYKG
jgi:carboxypeptidase Taq